MVGAARRALGALLLLAACTPAGDAPAAGDPALASEAASPAVRDVRVAESVNGVSLPVYAILDGGSTDDALVALRPAFDAIGSLHRMEQGGGMMTMRPTERGDVPAGDAVELRPGVVHGMLEELEAVPAVGDTLTLTFVFASGIEVEVRAPVLALAEIAGGSTHAH